MRTRDKSITINSDFVQGHTIEMAVAARNESQNEQHIESNLTPKITLNITGKTSASAAPSGLIATTSFYSVFLDWDNPVDYDFDQIDVYAASSNIRTSAFKIGTVRSTSYTHNLGAANLTRYYWIKAKNTAGVESVWHPLSPTAGVEATTGAFPPADIDDFAVIASKMFQKIPVLDGDTWTDNTPGAGDITWNAHSVYYNGARYLISTDNSDKHYIYWVVGNTGGSGTVADPYLSTYSDAAAAPTQTDTLFIIATNISGTHNVAWNSIANQVIGSAYITDASITNAKIANLAVDTAQIANAAITNLKVTAGLSADKITTGTLTGRTVRTASSGKRIVLSQADDTIRLYDSDGDSIIRLDDDGGSYGAILYMGNVTTGRGGSVEIRNKAPNGESSAILYVSDTGVGNYAGLRITGYGDDHGVEIYDSSSGTGAVLKASLYRDGDLFLAKDIDCNGSADIASTLDVHGELTLHNQTASMAAYIDSQKQVSSHPLVSYAELGYLNNCTENIQSHMDATYAAHHPSVSGDLDRQSGAILYGGVSYTMVIDNYGHITSMEEIT